MLAETSDMTDRTRRGNDVDLADFHFEQCTSIFIAFSNIEISNNMAIRMTVATNYDVLLIKPRNCSLRLLFKYFFYVEEHVTPSFRNDMRLLNLC